MDEDANVSWHEDLRELSGIKLLDLAVLIQTKAEFKRVQKNDIGPLISDSIRSGHIKPDRISVRIRKKLDLGCP